MAFQRRGEGSKQARAAVGNAQAVGANDGNVVLLRELCEALLLRATCFVEFGEP
ncbi:hypothetical protein D3C87_1362420 [compost metagenome]